jgi:hypothetical protein
MGESSCRDQALLSVDLADVPHRPVTRVREHVREKAGVHVGAGEGPVGMGIASQQHAVASKQPDRIRRPQHELLEQPLEILLLNRAHDEPEQFTVRVYDFAGDVNDPQPGAAVERRLADEPGKLLIRFQGLEIAAVGDVCPWYRPVSGKVDQIALGIDQSNGLGLRQAADFLREQDVDIMGLQPIAVVLPGSDREQLHALDQLGL